MDKRLLITGSVFAGLAVAIGAFGAHALAPIIETYGRLETFDTAIKYHMFHALSILLTGILFAKQPHKTLKWAGSLFSVGIILFSGSLYTMSITGINMLGMITPFGGVMFIAGWTLILIYLIKAY